MYSGCMTNVININPRPRLCKHVGNAMGVVYDYILAAIPVEQDRIDTEYDTAIKLLARISHTLDDPTEFIADMNAHLKENIDSFNKEEHPRG